MGFELVAYFDDMDHMVILATSRNKLLEKLGILYDLMWHSWNGGKRR